MSRRTLSVLPTPDGPISTHLASGPSEAPRMPISIWFAKPAILSSGSSCPTISSRKKSRMCSSLLGSTSLTTPSPDSLGISSGAVSAPALGLSSNADCAMFLYYIKPLYRVNVQSWLFPPIGSPLPQLLQKFRRRILRVPFAVITLENDYVFFGFIRRQAKQAPFLVKRNRPRGMAFAPFFFGGKILRRLRWVMHNKTIPSFFAERKGNSLKLLRAAKWDSATSALSKSRFPF